MFSSRNKLQSLIYTKSNNQKLKLSVLNQLLLPDKKVYVDIPTVEVAWSVIRNMQIRGAPLIAIVAILGLAVDLSTNAQTKSDIKYMPGPMELYNFIREKMDFLRTSRPTAVNLFNALDELTLVINNSLSSKEDIIKAVIKHAEIMLKRDVTDNESIGSHGADALLSHKPGGIHLVTICNTGSLATAGYGTALGVARSLHKRNKLLSITALETRPYNQGSRLTSFEIMEEQMPGGRLICDSATAALMQNKQVDACVVGADRVCANGDTANKIGTYQLAVVAAMHNKPFYVASPFTTLDTRLQSGEGIEIEERPAKEMIDSSRAPKNMCVWNPAFDVTPAKWITGIITEKGIIPKEANGTFDIPNFINKHRKIDSKVSSVLKENKM